MTHPLVQWLAAQHPQYDLSSQTPEKALRLAVHELAHAISLKVPLLGMSPTLVGDACAQLTPEQEWREEVLARTVEHVVLPRITETEQPTLEQRLQVAINVVKRAHRHAQGGVLIGYRDRPPPMHLPLEESVRVAHDMIDSGEAKRIAETIIAEVLLLTTPTAPPARDA